MWIFIELISAIVDGLLNAAGGYHWLFARRYLMPLVLAITISFICQSWWVGLTVLPVIGTLCLGYFSNAAWGRALWLLLQSFVIGFGITVTHHLHYYFYIAYMVGAAALGFIYKDWKQTIGDFLTGLYLGFIIFFVR